MQELMQGYLVISRGYQHMTLHSHSLLITQV